MTILGYSLSVFIFGPGQKIARFILLSGFDLYFLRILQLMTGTVIS